MALSTVPEESEEFLLKKTFSSENLKIMIQKSLMPSMLVKRTNLMKLS
jgi:hypothetical protein